MVMSSSLLEMQQEFGSFDAYIWRFVGGKSVKNRFIFVSAIPVQTAESDTMSLALRKRGFEFVSSTICYIFMQAVGMVSDHTTACFRHGPGVGGGPLVFSPPSSSSSYRLL